MTDRQRWRAVRARDPGQDGAFVYAVLSTGVYCRPSCPSRRPGRDKVVFFDLWESAEEAGFRACKRCRPREAPAPDRRIALVRRACRLVDAALEGPEPKAPTLAALAREVGLSPHHFQRVFMRFMGVSPREYAEARRLDRFKAGVRDGEGVTAALYGAGYGAPSRLYERARERLGMTPASYAKGGAGALIGYAIVDCPDVGGAARLLVAATEQGVCKVGLGQDDDALEAELAADYPAARLVRDAVVRRRWVARLIAYLDGTLPHPDLPLDVRGTAFQWRVWRALAAIPPGKTRTYRSIACGIGRPTSARAVGGACAANPVALVIPCHRAVREDGGLGGYRWGLARKRALLAQEAAGKGAENDSAE